MGYMRSAQGEATNSPGNCDHTVSATGPFRLRGVRKKYQTEFDSACTPRVFVDHSERPTGRRGRSSSLPCTARAESDPQNRQRLGQILHWCLGVGQKWFWPSVDRPSALFGFRSTATRGRESRPHSGNSQGLTQRRYVPPRLPILCWCRRSSARSRCPREVAGWGQTGWGLRRD
jgi:hypothetical protein